MFCAFVLCMFYIQGSVVCPLASLSTVLFVVEVSFFLANKMFVS